MTVEQVSGTPSDGLVGAAKDAELLVLGSRGLSGVGGFLVGSVGLSVVARAELPVVLVRADEQAADGDETNPEDRPVVLGLDADGPSDAVIEFAFAEAARRGTSLRVVYGWSLPPYYAYGFALDAGLHDELSREETDSLTQALRPWRQNHPDTEVFLEPRVGSAADHLVDASREASRRHRPPDQPRWARCPHRPGRARRPAPLHRPRSRRRPRLTHVRSKDRPGPSTWTPPGTPTSWSSEPGAARATSGSNWAGWHTSYRTTPPVRSPSCPRRDERDRRQLQPLTP